MHFAKQLCTLQNSYALCKAIMRPVKQLCTLQNNYASCKTVMLPAKQLCTLQNSYAPCKTVMHSAKQLCTAKQLCKISMHPVARSFLPLPLVFSGAGVPPPLVPLVGLGHILTPTPTCSGLGYILNCTPLLAPTLPPQYVHFRLRPFWNPHTRALDCTPPF